jgi:hypothetical protein
LNGEFEIAVRPSAGFLGDLRQFDFELDGTSTTLTEWSSVDLYYTGQSAPLYFNLNYEGQWVLQNIPVLSREGAVPQFQTFSFHNGLLTRGVTDLTGTSPGVLAYTLTAGLSGMPSGAPTGLTFRRQQEVFWTGGKPESTLLNPAPSTIVGATAPVGMKAAHEDFPNQQSGPLECAPTAISNSLMFLKNSNPSDAWNGLALDRETMKTATKWESDGCWIFHDDTRTGTSKNAFWEDKDEYMQANGYPVMTTTTTNLGAVLQAVKDGKDVELELKGHTVAVVGIVDLGGGKYSIDIAHDALQDDDSAGLKVETIQWDGSNWSGTKWLKGFNYAVIEMFMERPGTGTSYCPGDGSASPCPCGNSGGAGEGCANGSGSGARSEGTGSTGVGADDLQVGTTNLLPGQPALLFVGQNAVNNGDGASFGDGLRCAGQGVVRLGVRVPDAGGTANWGPNLGGLGGWVAGDTRYFQAWYRDPQGSPCGAGFNLSNGLEVTFTP